MEYEHDSLVKTIEDSYDTELDEMEVRDKIENWYPLFYFPNGDAFCVDRRDNKIYFYEHELFDPGANINGIKIANNINELYQKWSAIDFADLYYWDEYVNDDGLDVDAIRAELYK